MPLVVEGHSIATTPEGFLVSRADWSVQVADALAKAHCVQLGQDHWEIINLLQQYCDAGNEPPSMRELVGEIRQRLTNDKAKSIYLMKLFGASPAKMAARLAGLPKPKNCL